MRFDDKVAVVTGGAAGIGRATAGVLVDRGARVIIADRDEQEATATAEELGAAGALGVRSIGVDVADEESVRRLADFVRDAAGGVDVLVNNAAARLWDRSPRPIRSPGGASSTPT